MACCPCRAQSVCLWGRHCNGPYPNWKNDLQQEGLIVPFVALEILAGVVDNFELAVGLDLGQDCTVASWVLRVCWTGFSIQNIGQAEIQIMYNWLWYQHRFEFLEGFLDLCEGARSPLSVHISWWSTGWAGPPSGWSSWHVLWRSFKIRERFLLQWCCLVVCRWPQPWVCLLWAWFLPGWVWIPGNWPQQCQIKTWACWSSIQASSIW